MLKILIAVAFLCLAVFFGPQLADSQGFIHIATENYIVETSITTAVVVIIVAFVVLHFLVNLITSFLKLPSSTSKWLGSRKEHKFHELQVEAQLAYDEGSYKRALALIKKAGSADKLPITSLLLAARCAFERGDLGACRQYLDQAERLPNGSDIACNLLRAQLNLKIGNVAAALEYLDKLRNDTYTHDIVLRLRYECYLHDGAYQQIHDLMPELKKIHLLSADEEMELNKRYVEYRLLQSSNIDEVVALADSLNHQERQKASFMVPILNKLVFFKESALVSKYVQPVIKYNCSDELLAAIASWPLALPEVLSSLKAQAAANVVGSVTNVALLTALANLELKANELTEAKEHLKQALEVTKNRQLYLLAAELNERLSQYDEATKFFTLALTDSVPAH